MLNPPEGELYRVEQGINYMEGEILHAGDLHLVTRSNGHIINTMCEGALHTWYADDFLSCAERVEEGS